jgi:hypothetical protein
MKSTISERGQCIAYHIDTGDRCRKAVGGSRVASSLCLCRTHARSSFLALSASTSASRRAYALRHWDNIRDLEVRP